MIYKKWSLTEFTKLFAKMILMHENLKWFIRETSGQIYLEGILVNNDNSIVEVER
jgi:hypothetical protein